MINKIKALGLAFIAVAAMSAVAASAAQAGSLDVGAKPAVITAQIDPGQEHFLKIPLTAGGELASRCTIANYEGTTPATQQTDITELTVTATYTGCKVGGLAANVRMNGCKYTITGAAPIAAKTALVDIVGCTSGKQIEIEQIPTGCIVTVQEQNSLSHVVFTQIDVNQVTDEAKVANVTFTQGAACPNPGHHGANASFTGNTIAKAFVDAGKTQVTKHQTHQYDELLRGAQVSLTAT